MKVKMISQLTGVQHTMEIDVTQEQVKAWQSGVLIQRAMPNLTPDEREFLMSGITKDEWDNYFHDPMSSLKK